MATQPVLQGTTLPWPRNPGGVAERSGPRAVSSLTAGGNLVFQRLTSSVRREFSLTWTNLTNTQYGTLRTAYAALLGTGGSNNYTHTDGSTYTVTPLDGCPPLEASYVETPAGGGWDVTMRLREATN